MLVYKPGRVYANATHRSIVLVYFIRECLSCVKQLCERIDQSQYLTK